MNRKQHAKAKSYLNYLFVITFGVTVLYSFSLIPSAAVTGLATDDSTGGTPDKCQKYAEESDQYCDDSQDNCAGKYVEGVSIVACHECTTGIWKQKTWCKGADVPITPTTEPKPPTTIPSGDGDTPSQCQAYADANDNYCDDSQDNCASNYVKGTSFEKCHECTTGKWKQAKWCKGPGVTTITTTTIVSKSGYKAQFKIDVNSWGQTGFFFEDNIIVPTYRFGVSEVNESTATLKVRPSYGDYNIEDPNVISPVAYTFTKIGESATFKQEVGNSITITLLGIEKA